MEEMLMIVLEAGTPPVLHVQGELDIATAPELRKALADALSDDASLVLDLAGVTFVDASGLRVILQAADSLNGRGPMTLVHAERVAKLLDVVGLSDTPSIVLRDEV